MNGIDHIHDNRLKQLIEEVIRYTRIPSDNIYIPYAYSLNETLDMITQKLNLLVQKTEDLNKVIINQHLTSIDVEKDIFWRMYLSDVVEDKKIALGLIKDEEILKII